MKDFTLHPVFLTFKDKILEKQFRLENDLELIIFYRAGIYLSVLSWIMVIVLTDIVYPEFSRQVFVIVCALLFPLFAFIIVITYFKRYLTYYQPLCALGNFLAAIVGLYTIEYLINDYSLAAIGIVMLLLFAHFIMRLRFKIALSITLIYTAIAQIVMLVQGNYTPREVFHTLIGFWLGFVAISVGGYFLEKSTRQSFKQNLTIKKQQSDLVREQEKSEKLLLNILPKDIAERLKTTKEEIIADRYESISVLFADIVDFTDMSSSMKAEEVVSLLNDIFTIYDGLTEKHGLEKIKTIGDSYMVGAGIPRHSEVHAKKIIDFSLDMMDATKEFNLDHGKDVKIRVGINSGPAVAGIIGKKKFLYDLWGDTVNIASRMESSGIAGKIQIAPNTYSLARENFAIQERGLINVKGKGKVKTYFVLGKVS